MTDAKFAIILPLIAFSISMRFRLVTSTKFEVARVKGDFTIGALFPIRETPHDSFATCGLIREQYGMQRVEAALWAVDKINKEGILPNISLGIEIRDSCWNPTSALHQSLQFVDTSCQIYKNVKYRSEKSIFIVLTDTSETEISPMIGIVGPASSEEVMQVQTLLQIFHVPQVGYSATCSELSDKNQFKYFVRVVPSDEYQVDVILKILQNYNWTYVNVVNTEGVYGSSGINKFKMLADENNICIAGKFSVQDNDEPEKFDKIVLELQNKFPTARVIVCFCQGDTVRNLLMATKRCNSSRHYLFIGTDGWAGRHEIVKDVEAEAEGSIVIQIYSPDVVDFPEFYFKMKERQMRKVNPWIYEFWKFRFNCSFLDEPGWKKCTGNEDLRENYTQDPKLSFVVKSVYTFAHSLKNYCKAVCRENETYCPALKNFNTTIFMDYVRNVSFKYDGETISFNSNGDPLAKYKILNYQKLDNQSYSYVPVGDWTNYTMRLNSSIVKLPNNTASISSSYFNSCSFGFYQDYPKGLKTMCFWKCEECEQYQYSDSVKCSNCSEYQIPNQARNGCDNMKELYVKWTQVEVIICLVFATLGTLLSVFSVAMFYKYGDTPVVKSSDKELSCIMFLGMMFLHLCVFIILGKPTELRCALERVLPGVSLTIMYSALLVKINRIWRILSSSKKRFPQLRPRFVSLRFQVLVCALFNILEALICMTDLHIRPAQVKKSKVSYLTPVASILHCEAVPEELIVSYLFNCILLALCTWYAFKTRTLPDNFNEAKFIGFSCYATGITWVACMVVYHTTIFKLVSLCIALSATALINLTFLFFPKLYIIFWRPQKNSREYFKTTNTIRCNIGAASATRDYELLMRSIIRSRFIPNLSEGDMNIKLEAFEAPVNGSTTGNGCRMETVSCQTCSNDFQ